MHTSSTTTTAETSTATAKASAATTAARSTTATAATTARATASTAERCHYIRETERLAAIQGAIEQGEKCPLQDLEKI